MKAAVIGSVVRWLAHLSQNRTDSFQEQPSSSAVNMDKRSATAQTLALSLISVFVEPLFIFPYCAYVEEFTSKYDEILILKTSQLYFDVNVFI